MKLINKKVSLANHIIEVTDTVFDKADINHLSKTISRHKRITAHVDYGVGALISSIGLYFQVMALDSLTKQLEKSDDNIIRFVLKGKVVASYSAIIAQTTEMLMKLVLAIPAKNGLFLGTANGFYTVLSKKMLTAATIGRVVAFVDSALGLCQSIISFRQGNSGATIYVGSSILSLICTIASFAAPAMGIPLIGQIALFLGGIAAGVITLIYYNDGSDWSEIDKWLNLFGNYDHRDKYPPYYLPTPVCQLLSQQDYYLAVNGGKCEVTNESEHWYNDKYDIYLDLRLPDFNEEKAEFEGTVTIKIDTSTKEPYTYAPFSPLGLCVSVAHQFFIKSFIYIG